MKLISAGTFTMGDIAGVGGPEERPHTVSVSSFYISDHEVTFGEYFESNLQDEDLILYSRNELKCYEDDCPIINISWNDTQNISWNDTQDYISWLNTNTPASNGTMYRLCTEAEWEYAARGGSKTKWSCGDDVSYLQNVAWYDESSGLEARQVKKKDPNAFGLYDMHGNVSEWFQDWYDESYYSVSTSNNPTGPLSGRYRVDRGGHKASPAFDVRSVSRRLSSYLFFAKPDDTDFDSALGSGEDGVSTLIGFRLCAQ